ncbi:MAG: FtsW/RodA/SpoVE family cell cycle protein [Erysipelothrix sp.]|nr:FtsW/RodA/SpoVE family cell cycle protein [Erysipelothrix sp.]
MRLASNLVQQKFNMDWVLLGILGCLFSVSLLSIYMATPLLSAGISGLVNRQIVWYVTGAMLVGVLLNFGINNLYGMLPYIYWFLMFMLSLLIIDRFTNMVPFVREINNARAWFVFPGIGNFQPSEFMKIVLILRSAEIISTHNQTKLSNSYAEDFSLFMKIFKVAIPPLILIILQPDTGIPLIIIFSLVAMVFVSGIKKAWIYVSVLGFAAIFIGFLFIFFTNQQLLVKLFGDSLRISRFYGWLEPEKYVRSWGNQLYQGLLALGSAGLTGHPLKEVVVSFAEPQNDFIFAVIGQNFGFIGTTLVVTLSGILDLKFLSIAYNSDNQRDKLMVAGVLGMIVFQQVENMGMITGLLPITGITLPFISYGGSSLWSYMIPLAVIFKMSSDNIQKNGAFFK